ncbi:LysE family translocator [Pseudoalteromonas sp. OOF1S-7]|uniref:LysE family translocator n=1 Tax=Pseudoalteromonas sp. OOF1S-7 TaxID=2917757 RepID=UPI001EF710E9|nr:LysE family translocator [Pseudoalteromonas sp. OOF1S-7]MCG7537691.1 LysE family translocator [Pseudoalteromonas sp. OOF1S-7]
MMTITFTLVMAMCAFSLAMSISPGPVNMVIVSSGINHGVRRTMPFVSGATIGFTMLLAFIGFGFIQILERFPLFLNYLTFAGAAFIIYLGIKVARSGGSLSVSEEEKMATFWEGFALQWLNPKAWIACVSGVSLFSSVESHAVFSTFVLCYFIICYASLAFWAILGDQATLFLNNSNRLRIFNMCMGSLLIGTALYLGYSQLFAN